MFICHRFNDDDLLPLDVAAMLNQSEIAKLLMEKGAKDSAKCEQN